MSAVTVKVSGSDTRSVGLLSRRRLLAGMHGHTCGQGAADGWHRNARLLI